MTALTTESHYNFAVFPFLFRNPIFPFDNCWNQVAEPNSRLCLYQQRLKPACLGTVFLFCTMWHYACGLPATQSLKLLRHWVDQSCCCSVIFFKGRQNIGKVAPPRFDVQKHKRHDRFKLTVCSADKLNIFFNFILLSLNPDKLVIFGFLSKFGKLSK